MVAMLSFVNSLTCPDQSFHNADFRSNIRYQKVFSYIGRHLEKMIVIISVNFLLVHFILKNTGNVKPHTWEKIVSGDSSRPCSKNPVCVWEF